MAKSRFQKIEINQFLGLNTLDDPRILNASYSPDMVNMDITSTGALQTRFGYEEVCEISGDGGMSGLLPYYRVFDDNSAIDQKQDEGVAYANEYAVINASINPISEADVDKCFFTPTKSKIIRIAIYITDKVDGDWEVILHDASDNELGRGRITNTNTQNNAWNYFDIPYEWTSGTLHFHVVCYRPGAKLKANTTNDLRTASFLQIYSTKNDYLLLFYKGKAYYITNDNTTPTEIGSYGTVGEDNGQVRGVVHKNEAIYNDGYENNTGRSWNGTTQTTLVTWAIYPAYFGVYNNRLFISGKGSSTAYYSESDTIQQDITTNFILLGVGDGTEITSFQPILDKLHVTKENMIHAIGFGFDDNYNIAVPQEQPILSSSGGAYAPGSVVSVYNYLYFLSKFGFQLYGNVEQGVNTNLPVPLSFVIDNTVQRINFLFKDEITATFFEGKYMCAVPLGASQVNNTVLVMNEIVKRRFMVESWCPYNNIPARQFALFRDSNKRDQLYFVSALEPKLYKFNRTYSDAGFGYERKWRSKTFRFGERTRYHYLDIEGSKPVNGKIFVDLYTDEGQSLNFEINDSNFVTQAVGGGYIGDNSVGDHGTGGGHYGDEVVPMFRYRARIQIPFTVSEGHEMYFVIRNNAENEGWKVTQLELVYETLPDNPTYTYTVTN